MIETAVPKRPTVEDIFHKIKWVLIVVSTLCKQKFSGTLMLDFHEGELTRKYKTQRIHEAIE